MKSAHAYFTVIKKTYLSTFTSCHAVPFSWQCPFSNCFFFFLFFLFIAFFPSFLYIHLSTTYLLTQANITHFPFHNYAITYSVLYTRPETRDSNQNVTLIIIILSSFSMLTLMSVVSICDISVVSFLTSSLNGNQFTCEGKAQLRKAREERDPDCVKFKYFVV